MPVDSDSRVRAFKAQIQEKIQKIISEFAQGTISREQFHAIYERYTSQLTIAEMAQRSSTPDTIMDMVADGPPTVAVREAYMGKAIGMMIYHNRNGTLLETLGDFDAPPARLAPILNDFSMMMDSGQRVEREVRKISSKQWLLFAGGKYTTIVTLFHNEPSEQQMREIERLHYDFEEANRPYLTKNQVDSTKLAYPFLVFVKHKIRKP